jgi:hypothetical protein
VLAYFKATACISISLNLPVSVQYDTDSDMVVMVRLAYSLTRTTIKGPGICTLDIKVLPLLAKENHTASHIPRSLA